MRERGKAMETYSGNDLSEFNYSSSELPCRKHPSSSSVGICAYCLKDRLVKLVCSDCGEQRLSSCSCSEVSSYPNSCSLEAGSVGRISFLIENERSETQSAHSKPKGGDGPEKVVLLKRSSSSCVGTKRGGFWRIGRLFRKKRDKGCETSAVGGFDEKGEMWVLDYMGVSRSRSLCSFRGGGFNDPDEGSDVNFSSAKISDVNGGILLDSGRQSGFSEPEPRRSCSKGFLDSENGPNLKGGFKRGGLMDLDGASYIANRTAFVVKESDFCGMDDSGFIDLKLDLSSESKPEFSAPKLSDLSDSDFGSLRGGAFVGHQECGGSFRSLIGDGFLSKVGSCRITVNEKGFRKGRKAQKVWRWIFRQHPGWRNATKKDEIIS